MARRRATPERPSGVLTGRDDVLADDDASFAVDGGPDDAHGVVDLRFVGFDGGIVDVRPGVLDVQIAAGVVLAGDDERVARGDRVRLAGVAAGSSSTHDRLATRKSLLPVSSSSRISTTRRPVVARVNASPDAWVMLSVRLSLSQS